MLAGRSASAKPFSGQAIKPTRAVALPRSRAYVVKAVAKGPSKLALGLFGALAAAQLALLPAGPAEAFNLFPKTATSQAARDKLNKKTDDLPTVAEAGKELVGGSDPIGANNPKDVGKAVDKATPDVDLTKNPKSLGKDLAKGAKNALPDVSAVPTREEIIANAKKGRSAAGSVASKAKKGGGNPLSGVSNPLSGGGDPKKAGKSVASKASKTASKAGAKIPSSSEIQKKLSGPLGALPNPKDLANKAKVNTPNADNLASKAKASLPKPPSDLKNKIKSTPSATMGLSFELADLQGQNNQSENYPSPGKGYQAGKPSETIGAIPDKITSPLDSSMLPDPSTAGQQAPGASAGISKASEIDAPDFGKAAKKAGDVADSLPNPAEKAKSAGNPLDSVKGLFGQ
ncbi:hypothetical protein WJX79_004557 [Trebouxia sp. C0005]